MTVNEPQDAATVKDATQIWYKRQRVLRTAFTTILTALPVIPQVIAIVQGQWDVAWLTPVAVQVVAINTALTAIIALPTVNAWLVKIGLGSVPRGAISTGHADDGLHVFVNAPSSAIGSAPSPIEGAG